MTRIMITLRPDERDALVRVALAELRTPRDQARFIIRKEMEQLGMLEVSGRESEPAIKLKETGGRGIS